MQYKNGKYVDVPWPVVDPKNILDLTPGKMVEVKKGYLVIFGAIDLQSCSKCTHHRTFFLATTGGTA